MAQQNPGIPIAEDAQGSPLKIGGSRTRTFFLNGLLAIFMGWDVLAVLMNAYHREDLASAACSYAWMRYPAAWMLPSFNDFIDRHCNAAGDPSALIAAMPPLVVLVKASVSMVCTLICVLAALSSLRNSDADIVRSIYPRLVADAGARGQTYATRLAMGLFGLVFIGGFGNYMILGRGPLHIPTNFKGQFVYSCFGIFNMYMFSGLPTVLRYLKIMSD